MAGPLRLRGAFFCSSQPSSEQMTHGQITDSRFRAAWWLSHRHLQTIWPSLPSPFGPRPTLARKPLELPDGDTTAVDWLCTDGPRHSDDPLLVILHGLESSSESGYVRRLLHAAGERGWQACVLNFRDCSDYRNRLPRRYHAGETNDLRYFMNKLRTDGHDGPLMAAGYSLGGNVLLKYLGEEGAGTPLQAAVAVCVPLDLQVCADALDRGFSKFYQWYLLKKMKQAMQRKFDRHTAAFDWERAVAAQNFADFDDAVTAPLHGFRDKDEYYGRCSSAQFLKDIDRPALIINSRDDPFMHPSMLPAANQLAELVTLELADQGGHVGFIAGGLPWHPRYYLQERILDFLSAAQLDDTAGMRGLPGL